MTIALKTTTLARSGLVIPSLCFGTSGLGSMPDTYGYAVDDARARTTLDAILDGPVYFIDTSRNYGMGRSEQRIGEALKARGGLPKGFIVSTKLDRDADNRFDGAQARRSIEDSLKALGLAAVDMLHLHDPEYAADLSEVTRKGGAIDALMKMKEEGLCRAIGLAASGA